MAAKRVVRHFTLFLSRNGATSLARFDRLRQKITTQPNKANLSLLAISGRVQQSFVKPLIVGVGGCVLGTYMFTQYVPTYTVVNAKAAEDRDKERKELVLSRREQRFHDFASCELNGQIVMTPYDFIESLIENRPKLSRRGKIRLTEKDLKRIIRGTPPIAQGSTRFFRDLHQDGIIRYSEYLFLVTILTKSDTGLKIALKMMDVNGDKEINIEEFQGIERMFYESSASVTIGEEYSPDDIPLTTVYLHLFGEDGKRVVSFDDFFKFMDDLQSEVLELEFHEYSKSLKTISEVDFAKILLRNTTLTEKDYCEYIDRLKDRIIIPRGVDMEQFKAFNSFLSNIEDFIIAVKMTNMSGQEVDKVLFKRVVQVTTGEDIDQYIIDVVFNLFDNDGDGKLSQKEFIGIMKDRLKRGFGKFPNLTGFRGFKHCVKKEMVKRAE